MSAEDRVRDDAPIVADAVDWLRVLTKLVRLAHAGMDGEKLREILLESDPAKLDRLSFDLARTSRAGLEARLAVTKGGGGEDRVRDP